MNMFNKKEYSAREVFVPGGLPKLTYNPRKELELEERLNDAKDNLCKLVMMTGSTKSGKTVLTNNVFPREKSIWFDGGSYSNDNDFWIDIAEQLDIYPDQSISQGSDSSNQLDGKLTGQKQLLLFNMKSELGAATVKKKSKSTSSTRKGNPKTLAIQALRNKFRPLVIDDFHYLPRDKQGQLVRAIKSLVFDGLPVIFIAIPHRKLDAVKVEREMTGRVENIEVPVWKVDELLEIPQKGFPLLNLEVDKRIIDRMAEEAIGSPHLIQEFCRELCSMVEVKRTTKSKRAIKETDVDLNSLFKKVAENTGKVIFDKLSKGPRQRADRVRREMNNGLTTDIYGLVLYALAEIKPGLDTIDYETLRFKIREITKGTQPQAHEVSRVLDKMSQIAASDEASTPVIDWEKNDRLLHITDPFFAYYLRWGLEN